MKKIRMVWKYKNEEIREVIDGLFIIISTNLKMIKWLTSERLSEKLIFDNNFDENEYIKCDQTICSSPGIYINLSERANITC